MAETKDLEIDPEIAELLREAEAAGRMSLEGLPVDVARAQVEDGNLALNPDPPALTSVAELTMPGPGGPIRLRHYRPSDADELPVVVYFHGGGFVVGSLDSHDRVMRILALESGAAVVGVDYRLAPEHAFPGPLDDCVAAVGWIRDQADQLGIDPDRVVLAGDSAGANLALAGLIDLRDAGAPSCKGGLLFYGCFWRRFDTSAQTRFGSGDLRLSTDEMRWFWRHYLGDETAPDPRAEPLYADLQGLPRLFVTAAALDPLYDDTIELARRLDAAGADYKLEAYPRVVHGFLQMTARSGAARAAMRDAGQAVREMMV